jgi:mono/diheme cytochrome c family protein/uncharacterized cupredoxin-like copper-binding protein
MTDDRTGRELTPRREEAEVTPVPSGEQLGVDRFSAGPRMHSVGLTEERSAQVVRQSGNARNIAFLAVLIVAIFVPIYWFYDIGVPALGVESRVEQEKTVQYVTDVSQGYALFLANCARCHGANGEGGIGPPLNDQAKLYNAVTADGLPGKGHLNPTYITTVLEVGGRYVCGDPNSLMPVWAQPVGPLNYRQIEELVAWLTASKDITFTYLPATSELGAAGPAPTPVEVSGWRDPQYSPPPGAPTPPACWRNPSGAVGGGGGGGSQASAAPITSPGTAASPRVIPLVETASITITDDSGNAVTGLPVKAGEVVEFDVENKAGFAHNFYIGDPSDLQGNNVANLKGVPEFNSGVEKVTYTVPTSGTIQFACTLPGHYQTMHGDLSIQP